MLSEHDRHRADHFPDGSHGFHALVVSSLLKELQAQGSHLVSKILFQFRDSER